MGQSKEIVSLERALAEGRIGRREFLARAAALGGAAALSSAMPGIARAATPKKGGTLRLGIGHGSTTDSLDPATYEQAFMQCLGFSKHNYLTEVDSDNQLIPELAESWEASPDAKTWTFKLRKGIEYHNGKTMDAKDVVASFNHHRHEDSKSAAKALLEQLAEIRADGDRVVVFELKSGNADWPYICSDYHIPVLPATGEESIDWQSGTGTGAYIIESFEPGVRATLKRNPNYWKEGRGHFDEGLLLSIIDQTARTNALTTGEVDVMDRVDLKTAHLLDRRPDTRVEETSGNAHYVAPMRTDTAPFTDNNVRLALKHALDRQALVDAILRGHGYVGNDHPIGRANRYYAEEIPAREYDPDKAKFHLKQAGLSSLTVDLSAADAAFAGAVDAAVLYKEHAAKAGITIKVVREPSDGYWSNVWMQKPWCMSYWGGRPTEDWMFSIAYAADAEWNDSFWKHERFNQLLVEARAELDDAKRRELYVEMQRLVRDEGGVVIPMFNNYVFAMNEKVQHPESLSSNWDLDGLRLFERWWFA